MDQNYANALNTAKQLENQIKNSLDDRNHPISRSLLDESRRLVSEISQKRDPRDLENRTKSIMAHLQSNENQNGAAMDIGHSVSLQQEFEGLSWQFRKFENY